VKVEYINPFIDSTYNLFSTMLKSEAKQTGVSVSRTVNDPGDVTAIIGLSGHIRGTVLLSFPTATALAMSSKLFNSESTGLDDLVLDAVAEMVNIIAGGAKAKLTSDGEEPVKLSLPTVVRGKDYTLGNPGQTKWLTVGFTSGLGPFRLWVTFETNSAKGGE